MCTLFSFHKINCLRCVCWTSLGLLIWQMAQGMEEKERQLNQDLTKSARRFAGVHRECAHWAFVWISRLYCLNLKTTFQKQPLVSRICYLIWSCDHGWLWLGNCLYKLRQGCVLRSLQHSHTLWSKLTWWESRSCVHLFTADGVQMVFVLCRSLHTLLAKQQRTQVNEFGRERQTEYDAWNQHRQKEREMMEQTTRNHRR